MRCLLVKNTLQACSRFYFMSYAFLGVVQSFKNSCVSRKYKENLVLLSFIYLMLAGDQFKWSNMADMDSYSRPCFEIKGISIVVKHSMLASEYLSHCFLIMMVSGPTSARQAQASKKKSLSIFIFTRCEWYSLTALFPLQKPLSHAF